MSKKKIVLESMDETMGNLSEGVVSDPINVDDIKMEETIKEVVEEKPVEKEPYTPFGDDLVLYAKGTCHQCNIAKDLLERNNVPFTLVSDATKIFNIQREKHINTTPFMYNSKGQVFNLLNIKTVLDKVNKGV